MTNPVGPVSDSVWVAQLLGGRAGEAAAAAAPKKAPGAAVDPPEKPAPGSLESAVKHINENLLGQSVDVRFEMDDDADRMVVRVVDRASGDVIRQIPSEVVLRIAKVLGKISGALVDQSA